MKHYIRKNVGNPNIYALEFKKPIPMALMFMRLQEYTEGIKSIRGDLRREGDTILRYYEKRKKVYYKDGWAGFNLRGDKLREMVNLAPKRNIMWNILEHDLLDTVPYDGSNFFIIAYVKGDKATRDHELHHAYFYLDPNYRAKVTTILKKADTTKAKKLLKKLGYYTSEYILFDEINAYAMTDPKSDVKKLGLSKSVLKRLKKLSKKYVY